MGGEVWDVTEATVLRAKPLGGSGAILLTGFRLAAAAAVLPIGWTQGRLPAWAVVLFGWAALTDAMDGWLARRTGACTRVGAALDQWADKVWVLCALALLVHGRVLGPLAPAILMLREAVVTVRRWQLGRRGQDLPSTSRSKAKTVLQMASLWALLALPGLPGHTALIWVITGYTWVTGWELLWKRPVVRGSRHARA